MKMSRYKCLKIKERPNFWLKIYRFSAQGVGFAAPDYFSKKIGNIFRLYSQYKIVNGDKPKFRRIDEMKSKSKVYRTGEKPGRGKYSCTNCGTNVTLDQEDKMPPCPKCTNSEFTKKNG